MGCECVSVRIGDLRERMRESAGAGVMKSSMTRALHAVHLRGAKCLVRG